MTYSAQVASELADRMSFLFAEDAAIEDKIRQALKLDTSVDAWLALATAVVREIHKIEPEVVRRRMLTLSKDLRASPG